MARAAVETESLSTVVNVDLAVRSCPAVDTDAKIVALLVVACRAVLTRTQGHTLVHVNRTEPTCTRTLQSGVGKKQWFLKLEIWFLVFWSFMVFYGFLIFLGLSLESQNSLKT